MLEILQSTYFIIPIALIACFYLIWARGKRKDKSELFKDFDKLALFIFFFFIITRIFNFIAYNGAYIESGWNILPFTRLEDIETGNQYYLFFHDFPWIVLRFWDFGYFLFASILAPWVYSLVISKFKFGKVFETEFSLSSKISIVLVFGFLAYRMLNNNVLDLNSINIVSLFIMLAIAMFLGFTKRESSKLILRLSFVFMLALTTLELNMMQTVDTSIAITFVVIWLIWAFLLMFKYTAELQITRRDRAKSDVDLVKERAQIIRRYGVKESNSYSLSYKTANRLEVNKNQLQESISAKIRKIFNGKPQNGNSN